MHDDLPRTIVIFSARYLPSMGGVENFSHNLACQLARTGHEVLVVCCERADDTTGDARQQVGTGSVEVLRLSSFGPTRMPFVRMDVRTRALWGRLETLDDACVLINTRFYDLSTRAAALCRAKGIRPVLLDHSTGYISFDNPVLALASRVYDHAQTARLRPAQVDFYGVSRDSSAWLAHFGITSCGQIHNALDADGFVAQAATRDWRGELGIAPDALCVCFAARLLAEKGADTMIEVARQVTGEAIHLVIAGAGPMEDEVRHAAAELPKLSYVGRLAHPDLAALLLASDVFCFPTRYGEGLPTSLLEAAACGCALMATRAGGVGEIIPDAAHGVVLSSPDAEHVTKTLRELATDPSRLRSLQHAASEHVRTHFSWESTEQEARTAFVHARRG